MRIRKHTTLRAIPPLQRPRYRIVQVPIVARRARLAKAAGKHIQTHASGRHLLFATARSPAPLMRRRVSECREKRKGGCEYFNAMLVAAKPGEERCEVWCTDAR